MIRLGWGVFVRSLPALVSAARLRRMILVAVMAAVVVAVVLTVTDLVSHWVDASVGRTSFGFALSAIGAGLLAAACVRLTPSVGWLGGAGTSLGSRPASSTPRPTGDWRAQDRLAQYLGWSPPPILAEDREMVLTDVVVGRRAVASNVVHSGLASVGLVLTAVGMLGGGILRVEGSSFPYFLLLFPVSTVFQQLLTLGRGERARRQAEAIPTQVWGEPEPKPSRRDRPPRSTGSKLSLPDE